MNLVVALKTVKDFANSPHPSPQLQSSLRSVIDALESRMNSPFKKLLIYGDGWNAMFTATKHSTLFVMPGNGTLVIPVTDPWPASPPERQRCTDPACLRMPHYTDDRQCINYN